MKQKVIKICTRLSQHPKYGAGGAERQMHLIAKELVKKELVDFHYLSRKYKSNQKKHEIIDGVKVYTLGTQINLSSRNIREKIYNFFNFTDLLIFFKYIKKLDYDIFHLRSIDITVGLWAFFAKMIKRKKVVFTSPITIKHFIKNHDLGKLNTKIFEYGIRKADIVIALTEDIKRDLNQNYCVNSIVIKSGHPVPIEPFKKVNPPTILWMSRLNDLKRPELFLHIAKKLKDLNANFFLIGPGDYMKKEIISLSEEQKNFTFIPGVPSGKDNYYYARASLFVNTSIYEGFPNTFIQSWLRETPVVSLDVDPDCVICKNGLGYHAKGDINSIINKIKNLAEKPSILKEMGKICRRYAIKNHDIEKTAEQHYKLYQRLLMKH